MKRSAPATERNREPILAVLRDILPSVGLVLEVASGTGEHIVHFARHLPALDWQPSDPDPDALTSIEAWSADAGLPNLRPPVILDAAAERWPLDRADAILCINMVHISPWTTTLGLLDGAARLLGPGAPLYLYGPYRRADAATAPSNEAFDASLKSRNPEWGLRSLEDVVREAERRGFILRQVAPMPANNLSVILRRT